jgi:hypothetical protein
MRGLGIKVFLYNDAGSLTLVWSSFDPAYEAIVGKVHPWMLTIEQQALLEQGCVRPLLEGGGASSILLVA